MNPKLVTWDFGKEINLTLQDAVISWEEMRILLGATKYEYSSTSGARTLTIRKNAQKKFTNSTQAVATEGMPTGDGKTVAGKNHFPETKPDSYKWINMTTGARGRAAKEAGGSTYTGEPSVAAGETNIIRYFWEEEVTSADTGATELVISPDTFPGTLKTIGLHCGAKQINLVNCWKILFAR